MSGAGGSDLITIFFYFVLASARPLGMLAMIPAFTWVNISGIIRFAVSAALGAPLVAGYLDSVGQMTIEFSILPMAMALAKELAIGLVLGLVVAIPMYGSQLAGELADEVRGIQNPAGEQIGELEAPGILATLMLLCAFAVFYVGGGLRSALDALYSSWALWPLGEGGFKPTTGMADHLFDLLLALFRSGLLLSAPFVVLALLGQFALAFSARGLRGLDVEQTTHAVKNLIILIVLVIYSLFLFNAIAYETARYGNPLDDVRQMLAGAP
jgi:type III secretion protein T